MSHSPIYISYKAYIHVYARGAAFILADVMVEGGPSAKIEIEYIEK